MEKTNLKINLETEKNSIESIGINNLLDFFSPNWNIKKISSQSNQEFDQIFQIDNIPLSWFYKRLLSFHTIPPQFQTKQLIIQFLEEKKIEIDQKLEKKQKKLQRLYYLNEKIKQKIYGNKEIKTNPEKLNVLFLTYLDHANEEGKIFRLNNLIDQIKKEQKLHPLTITVTPLSKKFYSTIKKQYQCENNFYHFIKKEHKKQAKKVAEELSKKWQLLKEQDKINLFGNSSLWNCLRYPLEFYFSYQFIYTLILCYYTSENIIKENNIKEIVITSQHNIYERCLNAAANKLNIPVLLIQHGAGMGSINPELLPPYKIAVFSDYYKQLLIEQNVPTKNISVTGALIFDEIYPNLQKKSKKNKLPKILILTVPFIEQRYFEKKEYFDYIKKTIEELRDISCEITIKLHPREKTLKEYVKLKNDYYWSNVEIVQKTDSSYLYNLMSESDIIINFSSTTALEAMILDKPLITIIFDNFKNPFNILLNESKATREVHSKNNITIAVRELLIKDNLKNQRKAFVEKVCGMIDGKASERVVEIIYEL